MLINKHKKQNGQALPIGMALFLVLGIMSFVLFNTGQTVSDKSRLVNTADSAVYSGLLWQARAMNFQAYTNRAMVANQVAMAQAVSINSWSAYLAKTGTNLNAAFGWVPYVGVVTNIIDRIASGIDTVLNPISQGMLAVVNAVNASLTIAQEAMYYSAFVATPDVINSVVKSNEPEGQDFKWATAFSLANVGLNLVKWQEFTQSSRTPEINAAAENERFNMINASLDKFSTERNWKFFNFFIPITPLNWVRFEKAGTTKLIRRNGKYQWHAKDALSLRERRYTWRGRRHSDIPIAGASSFANSDGSEQSIVGLNPGFFPGRHETAKDARSANIFHDGRTMRNYSGLHAYRSLHVDQRDGEDPPTILLRIQISMNTNQVMDSDVLITPEPDGDYNASVEMPGDVMSSVSTAEMYFERPCFDSDCTEEFANGYSPYWDVRLVNTSGLSRLAAHTLQADVISDSMRSRDSSLERLDGYSAAIATPISDYQEQAKGVSVLMGGMQNHLTALVVDSPEYQQYKQRLDNIKANVDNEISSIASQFVAQNFDETELIEQVAMAAGYDLDIGEFKALADHLTEEYPDLDAVRDMSIDALRDYVETNVDAVVDDLKGQAEAELTRILENAVQNILNGLISSFAQQVAGVEINADVIDQATDQMASSLLNDAQNAVNNAQLDPDDIDIDLSNECGMWDLVQTAETEVADMQQRLEAINETIAIQFQAELEIATAQAVADRVVYEERIAEVQGELADLRAPGNSMPSDEKEQAILAKGETLRGLREDNAGIPDERVESLTTSLVVISNEATKDEFESYRLERRFARKAVIETLGDIELLEVDENGETVSQNLFYADSVKEVASDTEQSLSEKPAGCL